MVYQILAAFALDSCIKSKLRLTTVDNYKSKVGIPVSLSLG
jgi:hypothetical protein